jgi:hypothetical protein
MRPPMPPPQSAALPRFGALLAGLMLLGVSPLPAQEKEAADPARAKRTLRILTLGDAPPFRQEVRDGVRYELEPPAGSVPPRQVAFGEAASESIRLNLGRVSEPVPIPAGALPFTLRLQTDPAEEPKPWLRVSLPELGNVIALVWRDPGTPWDRPRALLLPENPEVFPAGSLRLVNLTAAPMAVILGSERLPLSPGQVLVKPLQVGEDVSVQLAYNDAAGSVRRFYSSSVLLNEGERAQLLIHRADGEKPRQPVKVVTLNERVP